MTELAGIFRPIFLLTKQVPLVRPPPDLTVLFLVDAEVSQIMNLHLLVKV